MTEKKHIYTVSELNRKIKLALDGSFAQLWVQGEVCNFKQHSSRHMYFSLKDENSELPAVLFRGVNKDLKFKLRDGIAVICFGRVSLYEARGRCQLYVDKIEPQGIGALQLAFEQLKRRLAGEGLFAPEHKRPIPFLPQRIGVVTSSTGAAIRDILHVLDRRFANLQIILNPVKVQGEGAAGEIARAIDEFNQFGGVDVLIVGRGGGSPEDLWAFNEEVVARAVYRSRIPVISAVGHEIDYTICDFVADLRAATPSAAAEQVIGHKQELVERIDVFSARVQRALLNKIELWQHRLVDLKTRYAFKQPSDLIEQKRQRIDELLAMLDLKIRHLGQLYQGKYKALIEKLQALSPLNILTRGYSITLLLPEEKIIKGSRAVQVGNELKTRLAQGELISKVEKIL